MGGKKIYMNTEFGQHSSTFNTWTCVLLKPNLPDVTTVPFLGHLKAQLISIQWVWMTSWVMSICVTWVHFELLIIRLLPLNLHYKPSVFHHAATTAFQLGVVLNTATHSYTRCWLSQVGDTPTNGTQQDWLNRSIKNDLKFTTLIFDKDVDVHIFD